MPDWKPNIQPASNPFRGERHRLPRSYHALALCRERLQEVRGSLAAVHLTVDELTAARDRARVELEVTIAIQDELVASIEHDMLTPLTAVKGQAQVLQRHVQRANSPDADRLIAGLTMISERAELMAQRVRDLVGEGHEGAEGAKVPRG